MTEEQNNPFNISVGKYLSDNIKKTIKNKVNKVKDIFKDKEKRDELTEKMG